MPITAAPAPAGPDGVFDVVDFIEQLEDLGLEIEAAMAAIAGDRLAAFEQSVSRQEQACSRLKHTAARLTASEKAPSDAGTAADPELAARLRATGAALHNLNAQYSALLRHSGQSVRLLASLCTDYAGRTQGAGNQVRQPTWSCEV